AGVTSIGDYAFMGCIGLTSMTLPEGVASIGDCAFMSCSGLTSITLPAGVTTIGRRAFTDCGNLTSIIYLADQLTNGVSSIFSNETYEKATLYLSEAGVSASKDIEPWKNFKNINVYDSSYINEVITGFNEDAPYEVYNLNGVKVGESTDNLPAGIYIVRQGNTVKKIAVK
ncbi:MAG: leucine-rich repeat domain-containing protein, partial [Duncaniella sp.]|nr:leucine-rich repeat domain-containing protein [Duncaniella sp.]